MIILDMDMPESCNECDLCGGFEEWDGCLVGGSGNDWLKDRRADDCPIVAEISDNPTNGDVFKSLFGDIKLNMWQFQDWWDTLYKGVENDGK